MGCDSQFDRLYPPDAFGLHDGLPVASQSAPREVIAPRTRVELFNVDGMSTVQIQALVKKLEAIGSGPSPSMQKPAHPAESDSPQAALAADSGSCRGSKEAGSSCSTPGAFHAQPDVVEGAE